MSRYDKRRRMLGSTLIGFALIAICAVVRAQTPETPPPLDTITVEAARHRELVVQQAKAFVARIAAKPYESSMARWQTVRLQRNAGCAAQSLE
jgi:hypothetical protein